MGKGTNFLSEARGDSESNDKGARRLFGNDRNGVYLDCGGNFNSRYRYQKHMLLHDSSKLIKKNILDTVYFLIPLSYFIIKLTPIKLFHDI